jgi:hypothetical protein
MNDSELDQLLKASRAPVPPPASFQRDVWLRVEAAECAGWNAGAHRLLERLLGFFALPPVAIATSLATVLIGAWFGLKSVPANPPDEVAYMQSISPFAHTHR